MQYYFHKKTIRKLITILLISTVLNNLFADTFTVTKTTDSSPAIHGELRWAIQQSNQSTQLDTINFNIPGDGPFTITPHRDLNPITQPVIIDGYSQPGSSVNSGIDNNNANLMIELSGNNYATGNAYNGTGNGLTIKGKHTAHSIIKGLVINNWINTGILLTNTHDISIFGNYIGTTIDGSTERANQSGIFIDSCKNITIGDGDFGSNTNIISGSFFYFNESACITMKDSDTISILRNYIGLNKAGTETLGNSQVGIECIRSTNASIRYNIISGHSIIGLSLIASSNNILQTNYFNTRADYYPLSNCENIGISLCGGGIINSSINNNITNNVITNQNVGIKLGYASAIGASQNLINVGRINGNNLAVVLNDNNNQITSNQIENNQVGGILLYGPTSDTTVNLNVLNNNGCVQGYGIQVGLPGSLSSGSNNSLDNNSLYPNNTITTLCSIKTLTIKDLYEL